MQMLSSVRRAAIALIPVLLATGAASKSYTTGVGPAPAGSNCSFPFTFGGVSFDSCANVAQRAPFNTSVEYNGGELPHGWCAVDFNASTGVKLWGACGGCPAGKYTSGDVQCAAKCPSEDTGTYKACATCSNQHSAHQGGYLSCTSCRPGRHLVPEDRAMQSTGEIRGWCNAISDYKKQIFTTKLPGQFNNFFQQGAEKIYAQAGQKAIEGWNYATLSFVQG